MSAASLHYFELSSGHHVFAVATFAALFEAVLDADATISNQMIMDSRKVYAYIYTSGGTTAPQWRVHLVQGVVV